MVRKNFFSILVALVIMYLSMANSNTFDKVPINIPNFDKIVHFTMYFGLMSVIILENRNTLSGTQKTFLTGLIPFFYGVLIEIMQATLTTTRSGSVFDALANTLGILVSILLWFFIKPHLKGKSDTY
jgi:VanZ family protein